MDYWFCVMAKYVDRANRKPADTLEVAGRLRTTREALKLTQAALCRLTGIAPAAWNNAETGDSRISLDKAKQLCDATGITLDWVYRGVKAGLPLPIATAIQELESKRKV
jgi:transcriptional regulator with XRE-family HTH domain